MTEIMSPRWMTNCESVIYLPIYLYLSLCICIYEHV